MSYPGSSSGGLPFTGPNTPKFLNAACASSAPSRSKAPSQMLSQNSSGRPQAFDTSSTMPSGQGRGDPGISIPSETSQPQVESLVNTRNESINQITGDTILQEVSPQRGPMTGGMGMVLFGERFPAFPLYVGFGDKWVRARWHDARVLRCCLPPSDRPGVVDVVLSRKPSNNAPEVGWSTATFEYEDTRAEALLSILNNIYQWANETIRQLRPVQLFATMNTVRDPNLNARATHSNNQEREEIPARLEEENIEDISIHFLCTCSIHPNWKQIVSSRNEYGQTMAHICVTLGYFRLLQHLCTWEIDLDAVDQMGSTALHYAYLFRQEACAKHLILSGASPSILDNLGRSPSNVDPSLEVRLHSNMEMYSDSSAFQTAMGFIRSAPTIGTPANALPFMTSTSRHAIQPSALGSSFHNMGPFHHLDSLPLSDSRLNHVPDSVVHAMYQDLRLQTFLKDPRNQQPGALVNIRREKKVVLALSLDSEFHPISNRGWEGILLPQTRSVESVPLEQISPTKLLKLSIQVVARGNANAQPCNNCWSRERPPHDYNVQPYMINFRAQSRRIALGRNNNCLTADLTFYFNCYSSHHESPYRLVLKLHDESDNLVALCVSPYEFVVRVHSRDTSVNNWETVGLSYPINTSAGPSRPPPGSRLNRVPNPGVHPVYQDLHLQAELKVPKKHQPDAQVKLRREKRVVLTLALDSDSHSISSRGWEGILLPQTRSVESVPVHQIPPAKLLKLSIQVLACPTGDATAQPCNNCWSRQRPPHDYNIQPYMIDFRAQNRQIALGRNNNCLTADVAFYFTCYSRHHESPYRLILKLYDECDNLVAHCSPPYEFVVRANGSGNDTGVGNYETQEHTTAQQRTQWPVFPMAPMNSPNSNLSASILQRLAPAEGPVSGGPTIILSGINFPPPYQQMVYARFGAVVVPTMWHNAHTLECQLPPSPISGTVSVTLSLFQQPGGPEFGQSHCTFRYNLERGYPHLFIPTTSGQEHTLTPENWEVMFPHFVQEEPPAGREILCTSSVASGAGSCR